MNKYINAKIEAPSAQSYLRKCENTFTFSKIVLDQRYKEMIASLYYIVR